MRPTASANERNEPRIWNANSPSTPKPPITTTPPEAYETPSTTTGRPRNRRSRTTLAQETLVPLPDDLTDSDYQALITEALGTPLDPAPAEYAALAQEITIGDAAEVWDTTPQAINRWIRDGSPKSRPPAWHDDAWHFYSKKDKRLIVDRIRTEHLTHSNAATTPRPRTPRTHPTDSAHSTPDSFSFTKGH